MREEGGIKIIDEDLLNKDWIIYIMSAKSKKVSTGVHILPPLQHGSLVFRTENTEGEPW